MSSYKITITVDGNDLASNKLKAVGDSLDQMEGKPSGVANEFGMLKAAVGGFIALQVVQQVGKQAVELTKLGMEVNKTEAAYRALNGSTAEADALLKEMRKSTGFVVDNLTLMGAANQLKLTGVVTSNEDIAELTGNVIKLGAALGQNATESLNNFNAALLNSSYARLDTLGVSAATVRVRVAELKDEGYDMQEAFAKATIEEMGRSLGKLGDAADANSTAIDRMTTRWQNFKQEFGSGLAETADFGLLMFETAGTHWTKELGLDEASQELRAWADLNSAAFAQEFSAGLGNEANYDTESYRRVMEAILIDPQREFSDILMQELQINTRTADPAVYEQFVEAMEFAQDGTRAYQKDLEQLAVQQEQVAANADIWDRSRDKGMFAAINQASSSGVFEEAQRNERRAIYARNIAYKESTSIAYEMYMKQLEGQQQVGIEERRAAFARDLAYKQTTDTAATMYMHQLDYLHEVGVEEKRAAFARDLAYRETTDSAANMYLAQLENQRQLGIEEKRAAFARDVAYKESTRNAADMYLQQQENNRIQGEITLATDQSAQSLANAMNLAAGGTREFNGMQIATQGAANQAQRLADEAAAAYEQAQNLGLEGDTLAGFRDAANETKKIADEMKRASDNLQTMNLQQALGSGMDPTQNMLRDVLAVAGVSEDKAKIATGETSQTEVRFNEQVAPLLQAINTTMGEDEAIAAGKRFTDAYMNALAGGLSDSAALNMALSQIGYAMGGEGGNIRIGGSLTLADLQMYAEMEGTKFDLSTQEGINGLMAWAASKGFSAGAGGFTVPDASINFETAVARFNNLTGENITQEEFLKMWQDQGLPVVTGNDGMVRPDMSGGASLFAGVGANAQVIATPMGGGVGDMSVAALTGANNVPGGGTGTGGAQVGVTDNQQKITDMTTLRDLQAEMVESTQSLEGGLSTESLGLPSSVADAEDLQAKIDALNDKKVTIHIHYKITNEGRVPPGADQVGVSVPTAGGEISNHG